MNRWLLILVGVFVAMLLLGCSSMTPKERYLTLLEKAKETSEIKAVYKIQIGILGELSGAMDMKIGFFKKGTKEKVVTEISAMGISAIMYQYNLDGNMISCEKGQAFGMIGTDQITCTQGSDSGMESFMQFFNITNDAVLESENIIINYDGQEEIIDRKCDRFTIEVDDISALMGTDDMGMMGTDADMFSGKMTLTTCIDIKTGWVLDFVISSEVTSELVEETGTTELMGFTALSFVEDVNEAVFELPVDYSILQSGCDKEELLVVLQPYKSYKGPVRIKMMDNTYGKEGTALETIDLGEMSFEPGSAKLISAKHSQSSKYSFKFELCLGEDCQSSSCSSLSTCIKHSTNQQACEAESGCMYKDPVCKRFNCMEIEELADCEGAPGCEWSESFGSGMCRTLSCFDYETQEECEAAPIDCEWKGTMCSSISCYSQKTEEECVALQKCKWENNYCVTDFSI